jgi:hypothetical protein
MAEHSSNDKIIPFAQAEAVVPKPSGFDINKFRSKRSPAAAAVETLQTALPICRLSEAKDFARLHPDEDEYWSPELCFVSVPIKGQKRDTLHLIDETLAMEFLPSGKIQRFRLALATKPYDTFFLCAVPTQNLDNSWVSSNLAACEQAKTNWVMASSRKDEGVDSYKVNFARHQDAFPEPQWPSQSLHELIEVAFAGRLIDYAEHPGLLRLIGARRSV